jgi:hypothetical protein
MQNPRRGDIIGNQPAMLLARGATTARVRLLNANSGEVRRNYEASSHPG